MFRATQVRTCTVFVCSLCADYCLKYANGLCPLAAGEECKILMFDVLPGKSKHIPEKILGALLLGLLVFDIRCLGMQPTPEHDSHSSANHLEYFLFNIDQCLPTHVLLVRAFENRRVAEDDEVADSDGLDAKVSALLFMLCFICLCLCAEG